MTLFTSNREKQLWYWVIGLLIPIFSLLFIGRPLAEYFRDRELISTGFWIGLWLIGITMIVYGLRFRPGKMEIAVWLGIAAVYLLTLLRMAVPEERSHIIEYSIVAIFVHLALVERAKLDDRVTHPFYFALIITIIIGTLDECIQLFLPDRVFDYRDILFNILAAGMALTSVKILGYVRKRWGKN
jgi:hypothetical protein